MLSNFSKIIKDEYIMFKYAKGPGAVRGKEFHEYHEVFLFIDGKAEFFSEKIHINLSPGQIVVIPKKSYHQFKMVDDKYHRCVFSFYDIAELEELIKKSMNNIRIVDANAKHKMLFDKLIDTSREDFSDNEKKALMRSVLTLILSEISQEDNNNEENSRLSSLTSECINLIELNLNGRIMLTELSKSLNVSVSSLTKSFKKDMGISVCRYISRKRLVLAQQKISSGTPATIAAIECGFNDYSGFYKQYKKMFNATPSEKRRDFGV